MKRDQITTPETPPIKDYQAAFAILLNDIAKRAHRLDRKAAAILEKAKAGSLEVSLLDAVNLMRESKTLLSVLPMAARAREKQAKREAKKGGKR